MSRMDYSDYRPRLPANGIRAQAQRGKMGQTWWAGRWVAALERLVEAPRLSRGRSYARSGQVLRLDFKANQVTAAVQGSRPKPYQVTITLQPLTDTVWDKVVEAMSAQALFAARLLAGEMPETIEDVFTGAGASLFPTTEKDLTSTCSCPDWANPCKHTAAVHYLLGERFDTDPFLMFELRGRTKAAILDALRARRVADATTEGRPDAEPIPAEALPGATPESLATFWSAPAEIRASLSFEPPEIDALPIKRLGPPPFWRGSDDFGVIMEAVYKAISDEATRLALAVESPTSPDGGSPQRDAWRSEPRLSQGGC